MKKTLSLLLALVMCLALVPLTASASYGNEYIQLEKSSFAVREGIVVTTKGITAEMRNTPRLEYPDTPDTLYVGLFRADNLEYELNYHLGRWNLSPPEGTFTHSQEYAPYEEGEYVLVLYHYWAKRVISSLKITVGQAAKAGSISIDKTAYTAKEIMTVTVTGITEQLVKTRAQVAIMQKDAPVTAAPGGSLSHGYTDVPEGDSKHEFTIPNRNGEYEVRLYSTYNLYNADTLIMSVPFTVSGAFDASDWAVPELQRADALGLIPDRLKGQDLTKPITRAEFAAVAVKLYENLTGKKAEPVSPNPFSDTKEAEILKAFKLGITAGTSATTFRDRKSVV